MIRARDLVPSERFILDGQVFTTVEVLEHYHPLSGHSIGIRVVESRDLITLDYSEQVTLAGDPSPAWVLPS